MAAFGKRRRDRQERTASGQPIYRHQATDGSWQPPAHVDPAQRTAIEQHYETFLGPSEAVWHEIVSHLVHIDVFMWTPTDERPMYTFATVGMSDKPVTVPKGALAEGRTALAELVVCLPPSWPVPTDLQDTSPWDDADAYFPIRWLKQLARLPHEYQTWLGSGHTIPNADPPEPFARSTQLCGWVLLPPITLPKPAHHLDLPGGRRLDVLGIVALHGDEMDAKLAHGTESLLDGFDRHGVSELLDIGRPSSLHV